MIFIYIDLHLLLKKPTPNHFFFFLSLSLFFPPFVSMFIQLQAMSWSSSYLGMASLHVASSKLCSFDHHRRGGCHPAEPHVARRWGVATAISDYDHGGADGGEVEMEDPEDGRLKNRGDRLLVSPYKARVSSLRIGLCCSPSK